MAEVKWIKLTTDMFDNRKIKYLRTLPEGNNIVLIWVMLLTMAGRCNSNGMIFLTENIPYTPKMLADELDFEESTVQLALTALENLQMVVTNNGYFTISGWTEHQNIEGMEKIREQNRKRKQLQRARQKQALIGNVSMCEYCGKEGATVDHIIPKVKGGIDSPDNTVCSCLSCNMQKSNRDLAVFLNEMLITSVDFELDRIISNKKIMKFVLFDDAISRFVSRNVTGQVTQSHAIDKEIEREEEIEGDKKKKSVKENSHTLFERLLPDYNIPFSVSEKLKEWLTYKTERKEPYKEQGMKSFLRQVENKSLEYGEQAICDLIDECMSSGWKGIIYDRLQQKKANSVNNASAKPKNSNSDFFNELNRIYNEE